MLYLYGLISIGAFCRPIGLDLYSLLINRSYALRSFRSLSYRPNRCYHFVTCKINYSLGFSQPRERRIWCVRFEFLGLHALGFMRIVMHVNKSFKVPLSFDVANGIGIECNSLLFCRPWLLWETVVFLCCSTEGHKMSWESSILPLPSHLRKNALFD